MEMDDDLYNNILNLCDQAEELIENLKPEKAITYFNKAFELIPSPKTDWEAGTWILTAIGDTYFSMGNFETALQSLKHAEIFPNGVDTSFLLFRIGQSFFELGNIENAREYLLRAYMLSGEEIFEGEEKYRDIIKDLIAKDAS